MTALFSFDGCVYDDLNGDGIILTKDASGNFTDQEEPGYGGVTVRVIDEHGNAVTFKTADGQDVDSVHTDSNGNYSIYGLDDSQKYKIQFDYSNLSNFGNLQLSPANVVAAQLGVNQSEKKDSDAVSQPGAGIAETDFITVGSPESFKVNLGLVKGDDPADPRTARIGNQVWEDANGNGRRDRGEVGVAGVSVTLTGAGADGEFGTGDDITQTKTTNSKGRYNFKNLAAGDYKVTFDAPDGFGFTQQDVGNDRRDSDADVNTGMTDVISLSAGERNNTIDAGLIKSGGGNNAPNATDDSEMTEFNTAVNINVLGNDSDPDGDPLSVTSINGQSVSVGDSIDVGNGTATLLNNGQISFDPDAGFTGNETFSYHVNDGNGGEDTANVTVQVKPPANTAPNATDDSEMTEFNTAVNINVLGNDSDPDGDPLSVTSIDGQSVSVGDSIDVGNGTATLLNNGQISFNPDAGFTGNETFSYHVNDGNGGEDTANVTVQVKGPANSAPNATDDSEMTDFNTAVNINVLGNDSDPDGDPLSVTSIDGQSVSVGDSIDVGNGTATLLNNGQISFDPDAGFTGNETFSYHVNDGNGGEDTANVTVQVKPPANGAPNANNDSVNTQAGIPVSINVLSNDTDPDGDSLSVTSLNGQSITAGQTVNTNNGSVTLLNNGQLSFNPNAGFTGNETFSYHVNDGNGGEDTANVLVNVEPRPNSAPNAVDDEIGLGDILNLHPTETGIPGQRVTFDLLANDSDPDGDPLKVVAINGQSISVGQTIATPADAYSSGSKGFVTLLNNGTVQYVVGSWGRMFFDDFTYTISDHQGNFDTANVDVISSPIAFDLNGNGIQTLSIDEGIKFDLLNTGEAVNVGWLSGEDGFLAIDNDGDGMISSRDELFGGGIGDGFAKLATYDSNGDGWVNASDTAFTDLSVWQDANQNGITDAGELTSLASHGITDLNTAYENVFTTDAQGNVHGEVSNALTANGGMMTMTDVYFQVGL